VAGASPGIGDPGQRNPVVEAEAEAVEADGLVDLFQFVGTNEHDGISARPAAMIDERLIPQLSRLGWDHIDITGDYVWSDRLPFDIDGILPCKTGTS
jgi:hypothetical protein